MDSKAGEQTFKNLLSKAKAGKVKEVVDFIFYSN
jgi:hypothetical protein